MAKQIILNGAARAKMLKGMNKLARAVELTLGDSGPGVMIQHRAEGLTPVFSRDGVTVAQAITLADRIEDIGARMLRDVASAVSRSAGDGTTTSVVLARKIAEGCARSLAAGVHPTALKKGLDAAAAQVSSALRQSAIKELDRSLQQKVCGCAGKDEDGLADLLAEAIANVGANGVVNIEPGRGLTDRLVIMDGAHWEQGYMSVYFSTDKDRQIVELDRPFILLYDREITDFMDLVPLLEAAQEQHRPLVVIAEDVSEKALAPLLLNHVRGNFQAVAVKPPGYGDRRIARLQDLAILTGGRACLESTGSLLDRMTLDDLGQAERVIVEAESITVVGGRGDKVAISTRIGELSLEADQIRSRRPGEGSPTGNLHDLEDVEERIALLRGKTARYEVGGYTEPAIKERLIRVENAYRALTAAFEEGVLPGGGIGLLNVRDSLDGLKFEDRDCQRGVEVVRDALSEPLRRIAANSGASGEAVLAGVLADGRKTYGFCSRRREFGDLMEFGIVDPVKVTRLALEHAVGIVGTVITTEAVISEEPISVRFPNSRAIAEWAAATREDPRA